MYRYATTALPRHLAACITLQRRTLIRPELLRTSEEEAISGLEPMELDDEQPVMVSGIPMMVSTWRSTPAYNATT
jgi:hypothetical protein